MLGGVCRGKESEGVRGAGVKRGGGALFGGFAVCSGRSLTRIFNGNTIECALCCSVESFVTLTGGFCELFGNFCPISTTSSSSVVGFGLYLGAPDPCIADCGAGDTALESFQTNDRVWVYIIQGRLSLPLVSLSEFC